jgi:hypothetical protein
MKMRGTQTKKSKEKSLLDAPIAADNRIHVPLDPAEEIAIPDEKIDEVPVVAEETDEEAAAEELSLDDDELDPFGDKWEG